MSIAAMSPVSGTEQRTVDEKPDITQIYPAHVYPTNFLKSWSEIEVRVRGHEHICGTGKRTGLTANEDWPVYEITSRCTPDFKGWLVALSPDGFVLLRRATI